MYQHNLMLANRLRAGLGLEASDSAIVSLDIADAALERLKRAGVKVATRAGRVRVSCHLYNDEHDVDLALEALSGPTHPTRARPAAPAPPAPGAVA